MPDPPRLTSLLLTSSRDAFAAATQCRFLELAGRGTLPTGVLQRWLGMDRLYAQAYVRFAGLLLANVPLLPLVDGEHVNERMQYLLVDALVNIRRELKFFEDVAERYGLDINIPLDDVSEGVRAYRALFAEMGEGVEARTFDFVEALVLLWGTEKCYLEAWRYAASFSASTSTKPEEDTDGGALRKEFIPNWTSSDFEVFVDTIGEMVDRLWEDGSGGFVARKTAAAGVEREERVKKLWARLLETERVFWPDVVEESSVA